MITTRTRQSLHRLLFRNFSLYIIMFVCTVQRRSFSVWCFRSFVPATHQANQWKAATFRLVTSSTSLATDNSSTAKSNYAIDHSTSQEERLSTLLQTWRENSFLNPTLVFSTWLVPSNKIQFMVQNSLVQSFLATHRRSNNNSNPSHGEETDEEDEYSILQHAFPRIKMVQEYNESYKLLLLRKQQQQQQHQSSSSSSSSSMMDHYPEAIRTFLIQHQVKPGPDISMTLSYRQLSFSYILTKILPAKALPPPTAYEQVGPIAHFNLLEHHEPYGPLIGQILVETNPSIKTVVSKVGQVSGPYRTYPLQILAGKPSTKTTVSEHGMAMDLDLETCYWCSRLSGERQRLIREEFKSHQVIADAFCGVGALCLLANREKNCTVIANDWNPSAMEYFQTNIRKNGLDPSDFTLHCREAFEFLTDLGLPPTRAASSKELKQPAPTKPFRLPDHVVMNYPLESPKFLGALRWWPIKQLQQHYIDHGSYPRIHVYTFARANDCPSPSSNGGRKNRKKRKEEDVAIDEIANVLIPVYDGLRNQNKNDDAIDDDDPTMLRREEFNNVYQARIATRLVRDVAPGKVVVCVSFSVTPKLLRHVQGDYR